ncbi:MAG TPA: hypothetical protein VJS44_04825 [Pyrinomonadaceae bacterium]|nr:hypothetical protein [Pyrinomonadaceae bacterium]
MKLNKETIRDPEVIDIEGATMLVPAGWKRQGGFVWTPDLSAQASLVTSVSDPQTGASVQTFPAKRFNWMTQPSMNSMPPGSNYMGSIVMPPPQEPRHCLQVAYMDGPLQHLRMAQFMGGSPLQQASAELGRNFPHVSAYLTRLRFAYNMGGGMWEEDVYLTSAFTHPNGFLVQWYTGAWSARAPAGTLDEMTPLLASIMLSTRNTLDWSSVLDYMQMEFLQNITKQQTGITPQMPFMNPMQSKMYQEQRRGMIYAMTQTPGVVWNQRKDEIRNKHRSAWESRQHAAERERIALIKDLGGLETYASPFDSSNLQLPSDYAGYWASKQGEVVMTKDAASDPNTVEAGKWQRMKPYSASSSPPSESSSSSSSHTDSAYMSM